MSEQKPKVQQLYNDVTLPDIALRPDSAAQRSRVTSNHVGRSDSARSRGSSAKTSLPMTAADAVKKYKRQMSAFELNEVSQYKDIYFVGSQARKIKASESKPNNSGYDDDKGRYKCVKHDHLAYRYEILKGLGKGSFGDVVKAYDHKTKKSQAVKIIRNERRFHKQGQIEIKILEQLKRSDKKGSHHLIHINEHFVFRNHICITFDLMHQDLYASLKKDGFRGFTLEQVRRFCVSLLSCLRLLRRQRIIHCDLKPENILLSNKTTDEIKVIDFGSACADHQKIHSYIQSRFYRAPEVILGTGYTMAIDIWSLGCIISELYTGRPIFPGRDEREQLMFQMEILGPPPDELTNDSKRLNVFFNEDGSPKQTTDRKGRVHLPGTKSIGEAVGSKNAEFIDFLSQCFEWDPTKRISPKQASKHPWITRANRLNGSLHRSSQRTSSTSTTTTTATSNAVQEVTVPLDSKKK
eukprot:m.240105 g.240105  ORF g.240105 m.240105 type:complete len:466 (+) comp14527_c0_seq1:158-1555(+)